MTDALAFTDPRLQRLYDYWRTARQNRCCPARRDLDPLDFGYLLGNISLIDVLRDPLRFRVRLHGSETSTRLHHELTGKLLDELPEGELRSYLLARCMELVDSGMPLRVAQARAFEGRMHRYEALWLPLSDDAARVHMLMVAITYDA
jgi:hypothetical protein